MKGPFFSVIVPAHNSQQYLWRCLHSVKMQKFDDYELIVVCDSCTDKTAEVALRYADKMIITNCGMDGLARNAGLDAAEGKWILFLDDDDWWIHEYVMKAIFDMLAIYDQYDMVVFDFIWKGVGYVHNYAQRMNIACWSKCYRMEFIGDTRFPAIPMTSDDPFIQAIIAKKPRCLTLNMLMYYYNYMRKGSQTEEHARQNSAVPEAGDERKGSAPDPG